MVVYKIITGSGLLYEAQQQQRSVLLRQRVRHQQREQQRHPGRDVRRQPAQGDVVRERGPRVLHAEPEDRAGPVDQPVLERVPERPARRGREGRQDRLRGRQGRGQDGRTGQPDLRQRDPEAQRPGRLRGGPGSDPPRVGLDQRVRGGPAGAQRLAVLRDRDGREAGRVHHPELLPPVHQAGPLQGGRRDGRGTRDLGRRGPGHGPVIS